MPKLKKLTHRTVPASVGLVKEVRSELRSEIRAIEHRLNSRIEAISSKVDTVLVAVHRTQVLMEEQRSENRIVLDGIKTMADRQDRLETEMKSTRF